MKKYRYTLKGNKKFKCPKCNRTSLVKYYDTHQKSFLKKDFGRCDHESSCGYWMKVSGEVHQVENSSLDIFDETGRQTDMAQLQEQETKQEIKYISKEIVIQSIEVYNRNGFHKYLKQITGKRYKDMVKSYLVGSNDAFGGSVIFWYINSRGLTTRGKVMAYHDNGKRVKTPYNMTTSMHKLLEYENYSLDRCFFGEHLLEKHPESPVAIVESEKTALIAAAFIPKYIWLAAGGKSYLNDKIIHAVGGRSVVLFPDSDAFDDWSTIAEKHSFEVSKVVKNRTNDSGVDLADLLVREFVKPSDVYPYAVKSRVFTDIHGRHIELVGVRDFGPCSDRFHPSGTICKACMFNCEHALRIDGVLQDEWMTHREVLDLQQVY